MMTILFKAFRCPKPQMCGLSRDQAVIAQLSVKHSFPDVQTPSMLFVLATNVPLQQMRKCLIVFLRLSEGNICFLSFAL